METFPQQQKKLTVNDMNAPDCGDNVEGESTVWAAGTRKIRVYCSDSGSGCTQSYYEKTFTGKIKEGTITIEDKSGKTTECPVDVYLDNEPPKCTVKANGTKGDNNWYITNVNLSLTIDDNGGSGVSSYGMGTTPTVSYNSLKSQIENSNTSGITWYGYVKDAAGNTATCNSGNIKKDSTAPQLTLTMKKLGKIKVDSSKTIKTYYNGYSNYTSGASYDGTVLVWTNPSDSTSGVASTTCTVTGADASRNSDSFANWRGVYLKGTTNISCYSVDNAGNQSNRVTASILNNYTHEYGNSIGAVSAAYKNYRVANYDWDTDGATKNWQNQSCSCSTHKFNSSKKGALVQCIHCGRTVAENGGNKGTWWCPAAARALGLDVFG